MDWQSWIGTVIAIAIALGSVALVLIALALATRALRERVPWLPALQARAGYRAAALLAVIGIWIAAAGTLPGASRWWPAATHGLTIAAIITGAWLLSALTSFGLARVIDRYPPETIASPEVRRIRTQLAVVRRLVSVLIAVVAIGAILFTFSEVRAVGASVLASAGIVSIIAGLAAQSTLGNLIAGIQLAFSDAIRVDDVVVVEGQWGRIGEITLSYVVVHIWDERRLVLPCTYFTSQPFETWTRKSDRIMGTVELDVDWSVQLSELRAEFDRILADSEIWDGRASSAVITDATGGFVRVRLLVSASNSGDLWNLRCEVREGLVEWLRTNHPHSLPQQRIALIETRAAGEFTSN